MEDEEDLSMVSDASSGPPHYFDEDDQRFCVDWYPSISKYNKENEKKKRVKEYGKIQQLSLLHDPASSPVLNCSKASVIATTWNGATENAFDYSRSLSSTRIKIKPKFQKHFSFFKPSLDGKNASEEQGGLDEEEERK
ncbi:hypothetical protein TanjilG_30634 [Lupinus angustifolius]|uniref:Uncharacterized protein n=1 Tax=Lupinus angustifolius TaxID=3871 RepID=A0A4P1RP87_LUPAN|nr:hypothetical protein TanjilG_30634 [Lupinus angustifolius]